MYNYISTSEIGRENGFLVGILMLYCIQELRVYSKNGQNHFL